MTSRSGGGGRAEGAAGAWSECGSASNCMPEDAAKVKEKQVNINFFFLNMSIYPETVSDQGLFSLEFQTIIIQVM